MNKSHQIVNEASAQKLDELTTSLISNENVNFCFEVNNISISWIRIIKLKWFKKKGYDSAKRYINVNISDDKTYWKFIYDYRINNIILLEDRYDEASVI